MQEELHRLSKEEWDAIKDFARTLRYFARSRKYGYIDRLANAYNPTIAEITIREVLREARSAFDQNEKVHLPSANVVQKVVELISRDLSVASILAALALTLPEKDLG